MLSSNPNEYLSFFSCGRSPALIFSIILSLLFCCSSNASKGGTPADSNQLSPEGQMTQYDAERSALAELTKRNPDGTLKSYMFNKLIHVQNPPPDLVMGGYFLCGRIEYIFSGKTYGPMRIVVIFSNDKILGVILYDDPEGRHAARSLCDQVEQIDSKR
jgi:hypothetical protein